MEESIRNNDRRILELEYRQVITSSTETIISMMSDIKKMLQDKKEEDKWFDIHEASKYANVSASSLRRYYTAGKLKVSNNLGKTLIRKSEIDNFLSGGV